MQARLQPSMDLADKQLLETRGMQFAASINPAQADKWFAGTGHTVAELLALADENAPLPKFPLQVTVRAHVAVIRKQASAPNVIGVLPGSDCQAEKRVRGDQRASRSLGHRIADQWG